MITTSSISMLASLFITIQVGRSKSTRGSGTIGMPAKPVLLTSPYHRIIFGISVFDIMQSFSLLSGPFAVEAHVPQALWAVGNSATCKFNGFFLCLGVSLMQMYLFFYCYFCFCKVNKRMTDKDFSRKFEWKMHFFIITSMVIVHLAALFSEVFNSSVLGQYCSYAAVPAGCRQEPDIFGDCDEDSAHRASLYMTFLCVIFVLSVFGITVCMFRISWQIMATTRRTNFRRTNQMLEMQPRVQAEEVHRKQFLVQALLYVGVHFLIYIIPLSTYFWAIRDNDYPSLMVAIIISIFYPVGGLLNILVFTRPKVLSLRRRHMEFSYFRAFYMVVKAGYVVPQVIVESEQNLDSENHRSGSNRASSSFISFQTPPIAMDLSSAGANTPDPASSPLDDLNPNKVERVYYRFPIPTPPSLRSPLSSSNSLDPSLSRIQEQDMETIYEGDEEECPRGGDDDNS